MPADNITSSAVAVPHHIREVGRITWPGGRPGQCQLRQGVQGRGRGGCAAMVTAYIGERLSSGRESERADNEQTNKQTNKHDKRNMGKEITSRLNGTSSRWAVVLLVGCRVY